MPEVAPGVQASEVRYSGSDAVPPVRVRLPGGLHVERIDSLPQRRRDGFHAALAILRAAARARSAMTIGRPDAYECSPVTAERGWSRSLPSCVAHPAGTRREECWRAGHGEGGPLSTWCTAVRGGLGPCGR